MPKAPNEPDRVQASVERQRLKRDYVGIFEDLVAYLYDQDPMALNFGINPDEYEPDHRRRRSRRIRALVLAAETKALADIDRYGCHVIHVAAEGDLPPFSYSVGIWRCISNA